QPVGRIGVSDPYHLGAEFFRWELATAVAGAVSGRNPFEQPDVEASKVATRALTDHYEKAGALPPESPVRVSDPAWATTLKAPLATIRPGDYAAFLAYIPMNETHEAELQAVRLAGGARLRGAAGVRCRGAVLALTGQ